MSDDARVDMLRADLAEAKARVAELEVRLSGLNELSEEALRARDILEANTDFISCSSTDKRVLFINQAGRRMLGIGPDEDVSGQEIRSQHPDWAYQYIVNEGLPAALEHGSWLGETALLDADGVEFPVSQLILAHRGEDGALRYFSTVMRDLRVLLRYKSEAEQVQRRYRQLVELAPDGIVIHAEGKIVYVNSAGIRMFGREDPSEVIGQRVLSFIHPESRPLVEKRLPQLYAGDATLPTVEERFVRPDDSLFYGEVHATPMRYGDTQAILVFIRDVTERRLNEQRMAQMATDLERHAQELERRVDERTLALQAMNQELEAFAYTVSHDLRAPIRAMRGFTDILIEDHQHALDEAGRAYLARIIDASDRMAALIEALLQYSRLGRVSLDAHEISLDDAARAVVAQLEPSLRERGAEVTLRAPLGAAMAHEALIRQVLSNLIENAIKFVPDGRAPRVEVYSEQRDERLRVWVVDNGIGIAPEHHGRVFHVFERLHSHHEYQGTGIGLAIVQRVLHRLDGRVGLTSVPGEGSRFWFELRLP
jgi:PAS domain S-box-containing protein